MADQPRRAAASTTTTDTHTTPSRDVVAGPPPMGADGTGAPDPAGPRPELTVDRTRTSSVFVAATVGLVLALLMLIFVVQNGDSQDFDFLWMEFRLPTGTAMLLAAVTGGLVVALLGLGRVLQLRLAARRHRASDRRAP